MAVRFLKRTMAGNTTKSIADIPMPYRQLFESYTNFNAVQSLLFDAIFRTEKSVVLSAPTGSGKTVVFEMAIVHMLQQQQQQQHREETNMPPKAIYVAPIKALCSEKFNDWRQRFTALHIECCQITGDSSVDQMPDLTALGNAQLIVTTPEKWDSMTRHWREYKNILQAVRLFMIDEVHLLNEDVRGPILEAIVSRMKTMQLPERQMRFIIASATIPNVEDLSMWLQGGEQHEEVVHYKFSDSDRPVPLEKHVIAVNSKSVGFQFDLHLNYKLADIIRQYSQRMATLIFCNSRKSAELSANVLERNAITSYFFDLSHQKRSDLLDLANGLTDSRLSKLVAIGIAFHHAGLSFADRHAIEDGFRRGLIMVLVSTNTLAMGVNLPAHLVIIKSTEYYCRGSFVEYSESTLQQMIGRAGRPQYDTKGVAVILTHSRNAYDRGTQPVESHLHKHLAEHLNSEIALNTISNLEMAMRWIRSTYLYVRSSKAPQQYGIAPVDGRVDKEVIEKKLEEMCVKQIEALHEAGLIVRHEANSKCDLEITAYGKLMAKYYLSFETMKLFRQIAGDETLLDTLNLIIRCKEFEEFTLRVNEKRILNELNKTPLRFPISGRIKSKEDKILCLIQSIFGNLNISTPGLTMEALKILRIGERVAKCMLPMRACLDHIHVHIYRLLEYLRLSVNAANRNSHMPNGGCCYNVVLYAVTIAKCFHAKLWENSVYASKQLRKIGTIYTSLLADAGKTTLKSIAETDGRTIEMILNKPYPFGDEVLRNLQTFPEYGLQVQLNDNRSELLISIRQLNDEYTGVCKYGNNAVVIVGDTDNKLHLFDENLDTILHEKFIFERTVSIADSKVEEIFVHVLHKLYVGVDVETSVVLNTKPSPNTNKKILSSVTRKKRQIQTKLPQRKRKENNTLKNNEGGGDDDPLRPPTEGPRESLKDFQYKKTKLQSCRDPLISDVTKQSSELEKLVWETSHNSSSLAQMKLTDYYLKRKTNDSVSSLEQKQSKLDKEIEKSSIAHSDLVDIISIEYDDVSNITNDNIIMPEKRPIVSLVSNEMAKSPSKCTQHSDGNPDSFGELEQCLMELDECEIKKQSNEKHVEPPINITLNSLGEDMSLFSGSIMNESVNFGQLQREPSPIPKAQELLKENCPTEMNDSIDPSVHWYKVCRAFMRLKPKHQHYKNFQRISQREYQKSGNPRQMKTSTPLKSPENKRESNKFHPDLETSFSTIAKVPTNNPNLNTTISSVGRTHNPYRLQLFKNPETEISPNQSFEGRKSIDDINRKVMTDLMRAKTQEYQEEQPQEKQQNAEEQPQEIEENATKILMSFPNGNKAWKPRKPQQDKKTKDPEDFKSFEEYCEHFMSTQGVQHTLR